MTKSELKQKELELKEREISLREKEMSVNLKIAIIELLKTENYSLIMPSMHLGTTRENLFSNLYNLISSVNFQHCMPEAIPEQKS